MSLIKSRAISIATSLAVLTGAMGLGQFAVAAQAGPTVALTSPTSAVTNAATIPVTATFSAPVSGFSSSSVTATNATVTNVSGSGTTFTFNVNPTSDGSVTVAVPADVVSSVNPPPMGNAASNMLTFTSDTSAPTIQRTITSSTTSAFIEWTTSEPAVSQVNYGLGVPYTASTTMETTASTTHSVTLTGLTPATTYHYEITATDAAGNMGTTGDLAFTTTGAPVPVVPVISGITVTPTTNSAMIQWDTASPASSQIFFGTSTPYTASTTLDSNLVSAHSVTLTGLTASTTYHYQIQSANSAGTATSADRTFTTLSASSTPVTLALTGIDSVNGIALPDGTYANGFKWVLHFTVPDQETSFALRFNDFSSPTASTTIPVASNLRYFSAQSSNATGESTSITETNNDYGGALNLTGDTSSSTPGRQIDVTVELKVPTGTQPGVYSSLFGARSL